MTHPVLRYRPAHEDRDAMLDTFRSVRSETERLASALQPEDMVIQAMADTSPTKWHLAHTTWFFEQFVLAPSLPSFEPYRGGYAFLFNSYYEGVGDRWARPQRGLLSRPNVAEILEYRLAVSEQVIAQLAKVRGEVWQQLAPMLELGIHHEQQHQELLCTDIKYTLSLNPLAPTIFPGAVIHAASSIPSRRWVAFDEGVSEFGSEAENFAFDNELPRHKQYLPAVEIAASPVTNAEVLAFIEDGGYRNAEYWLSDGWDWVKAQERSAPLYWRDTDEGWHEFSCHGLIPLHQEGIACHLSGYEAHALANWAGYRLPTEFELELLARQDSAENGRFLEPGSIIHPAAVDGAKRLNAVFGSTWEWTSSAYGPYPGFTSPAGAVGEYNGKFMSQQLVLRGGSCATPKGHIRSTYRNFFPPQAQWQFTGLRFARSL